MVFDLSKHVHVQTDVGPEKHTIVQVDHLIPATSEAERGWHVTTREQRLFKAHFSSTGRDRIKNASGDRGRRLFCIDRGRAEVVAAMAYHLDGRASLPAPDCNRAAGGDGGELHDQSRAAARLLKGYAHEIARQTGRGSHVDIDASPAAASDLVVLGFVKAPKVKGLRVSGTHLRQTAP